MMEHGVPAASTISFTDGDLACQPKFYVEAAKEFREGLMDLI